MPILKKGESNYIPADHNRIVITVVQEVEDGGMGECILTIQGTEPMKYMLDPKTRKSVMLDQKSGKIANTGEQDLEYNIT